MRRYAGRLLLLVAALGAAAVLVQRDAAERAAVDAPLDLELAGGGVDAAREGDLRDIELVLEQRVDNLDHALHRHRLLGDDQAAVGIGGAELVAEGLALHGVGAVAVLDALLLVDVQNGRQQRVVLAQNQRVVKVFDDIPGRLLNLVAGEHHVHARLHAVLHLDGEHTRVAVQILSLALETIETVGILNVKCCDTSHGCTNLVQQRSDGR